MRRTLLLGALLFLLAPGSALAADAVTLNGSASVVRYNRAVTLSGAITPVAAGETVGLYRQAGSAWTLVGSTTTAADGTFSVAVVLKSPATFLARATDSAGNPVESSPVSVKVRPLLSARLAGSNVIGAKLYVTGRLVPRTAGIVYVSAGTIVRKARLSRYGYYRVQIPTTRWFTYYAHARVAPATGFTAVRRTRHVRVKRVSLALGSTGPAARWLDYSLRKRSFTVDGVDSRYGYDTRDAVYAFQKVHGLARTGYWSASLWRLLRDSGTPKARIARGSHIEVSKTRQTLYEVRRGKVVSIMHVSTGATGNTPVGHFHIYWKDAGFNALGMYYSMYFHGGFAIHGYHSVPPFQASHGCVRTPLWFAPKIFSRWGVGASVYVFG